MIKSTIVKTDIKKAQHWNSTAFIEENILLTDRIADAVIPTEPRMMSFILVALCTKGTISYQMDHEEQKVQAGDLLIVFDRRIIDHYQASNDVEGLGIILSTEFFQETLLNVSNMNTLFMFSRTHPVLHLSEEEIQMFQEYFSLIRKKIDLVDRPHKKDLIRTLVLAMFYDLTNVVYRITPNPSERYIRGEIVFTQFIKLVEENCTRERRVMWYAQQMNISPKYLSEIIRQVSKRTPNEWVNDFVMAELRRHLRNTTMSISEIADALHFPNQSFLGKYFKEHAGLSPLQFRKAK
jgi:AraC-like DNA-binding protein